MTVHICTPYSVDKDLGRAYNEAMSRIPDGDWACLIDYDVMFLTPDCGRILHEYATRFPDAGLLTSYTNRIHPLSPQLHKPAFGIDSVAANIRIAQTMRKNLYEVKQLYENVSGFLMLISKESWKQHPFIEGAGCLGVDTHYWRQLKEAGRDMLLMKGLYVWHTYRLTTGIKNKNHLL